MSVKYRLLQWQGLLPPLYPQGPQSSLPRRALNKYLSNEWMQFEKTASEERSAIIWKNKVVYPIRDMNNWHTSLLPAPFYAIPFPQQILKLVDVQARGGGPGALPVLSISDELVHNLKRAFRLVFPIGFSTPSFSETSAFYIHLSP